MSITKIHLRHSYEIRGGAVLYVKDVTGPTESGSRAVSGVLLDPFKGMPRGGFYRAIVKPEALIVETPGPSVIDYIAFCADVNDVVILDAPNSPILGRVVSTLKDTTSVARSLVVRSYVNGVYYVANASGYVMGPDGSRLSELRVPWSTAFRDRLGAAVARLFTGKAVTPEALDAIINTFGA